MSHPRRRFWVLPACAALVLLPFFVNDPIRCILNLMMVDAVAAVGFNIVLGFAGQLAFANAAFFGLGAYATAILMRQLELPLWLAMIDAGMLGAIAGFVVSLLVPLLRGFYLAIATLGFGESLRWGYNRADGLTGGPGGLLVPPAGNAEKYFGFLLITALILWTTSGLLRSRFGRALIAVRDNAPAAASLGINPASMRRLAFSLSGFIVGIAGSMLAILAGRVVPDDFGLSQLLLQLAMVMIGGLGSLAGSLAGAVLLAAVPQLLHNFPGTQEIFLTLLVIGVLLFAPEGLAGLLVRR